MTPTSRPTRPRIGAAFLALALIAAVLTVVPARPASAAGLIEVNTLSDAIAADSACSLREAIIAANTDAAVDTCAAGSGADTIQFSVTGAILLGTRLPAITTDITIDATGLSVTLDGQGSTSVLVVNASGKLTLESLAVANGTTQGCVDTCGQIVSSGNLIVRNTTVSGGTAALGNGGAITNLTVGTLTVESSTFVGNSVQYGGGAIFNRGAATVTNSTFVGNASQNGGAIYNYNAPATITVRNSTFSDNTAAGPSHVLQNGSGSFALVNSIVSNPGTGADCTGTVVANAFNIDSDGTCGSAITSSGLNLQPLADNGGPTQTVALGVGSTAFDAADPAVCAAAPVNGLDQRGEIRPQGAACDVGAYESNGTPASPEPIAHWTFDEATSGSGSGTVLDSAPGAHDGAVIGGAQYIPGVIGTGALSFDGVDDYVDFGLAPALDLTGGDYTISFWIDYEPKLGRVISMDDGSSTPPLAGYSVLTSADCCRVTHSSGVANDTGSSFTSLPTLGWHHVALVYNSAVPNLTFYYDGIDQGSQSVTGNLTADGDDPLLIGAIDNNGPIIQFFEGSLDDMKLFDVALGAADVSELADVPSGPIVLLDASAISQTSGSTVANWGGQTAAGTPVYKTNQTPNGGAAVEFDAAGDRFADNVTIPAAAAQDFIVVAVVKPEQRPVGEGYHNLVDDDPASRPMLWIDPSFNYELNFSGGTGAKAAGAGVGGWDIVIADSRLNQLYVNSPTPNATGGGAVAYPSSKAYDFFHRDGGQTYRGQVAELRIYNDRADFGNDFAALHAELSAKWIDATAPVPVGHWPLDEAFFGTGTGTVLDSSGAGNDGAVMGGALYVPGIVGTGALSFDGDNDYVDFGLVPDLDLTGGDYTISFWADSMGGVTRERAVNMDDGQNRSGGYSVFADTNCCRATHNRGGPGDGENDDTTTVFATIPPLAWHHIALVYDSSASNITFFYDGVAQAPFTTNGDLATDGDDPLLFGAINLDSAPSTIAAPVVDNRSPLVGLVECRGSFPAPQCSAQRYQNATNLADPANGFAQPAVAKETLGGHAAIHQAQFVNDGYYGNGSSWIGLTHDSWVKIDLGCTTTIDGIRFGRDRITTYDDRDPGVVTISVALADDVYANGNAANDAAEYDVIYTSSGQVDIDGTNTYLASFTPRTARYIKFQTESVLNVGKAALDEIEVSGISCASDAAPGNIIQFLDGSLDEVKLFDVALSPAQIAALAVPAPIAPPLPANKIISNLTAREELGYSVAIDGDWAAVGEPNIGTNGDSRVLILERNPATSEWSIFDTIVNTNAGAKTGTLVALDGNILATNWGEAEVNIYERSAPGNPFNAAMVVTISGAESPARSVDISGNTIAISAEGGTVSTFDRLSAGNWQNVANLNGGNDFGNDIALDGDTLVIAESSNSVVGAVHVYQPFEGAWALTQTLTSPDTVITGDTYFGASVDLDGDTLVVGHPLNFNPAGHEGVAWAYTRTAGNFGGTAVKLEPSDNGPSNVFGAQVQVDGDFIAVGSPAHEELNVPFRHGAAFVFQRDGATWTELDYFLAEDRAAGDTLGDAIDIHDNGDGTAHTLVGAPLNDNQNGVDAGAAYWFTTDGTPPVVLVEDDPSLSFTFDLAPNQDVPKIGGGVGLPVTELADATSFIQKNSTNVTSVSSTGLREAGVAGSAIAGILVGDTPFGAIATSLPSLSKLPILTLGIDTPGGWEAILAADPQYDNIPLVNITVEQVFSDPQLAGEVGAIPFGAIDVNGTPFGAIPFGAIALGGIPLTEIPTAEDQTPEQTEAAWCEILDASTTESCVGGVALQDGQTLMSIALSDIPFGAIPFGAIPFGAIPIDYTDPLTGTVTAAPFGAINLADIGIDATPFGAIPFGAIDFAASPFGAIPFGAIPFGAIPFGAIELDDEVSYTADGGQIVTIPFGAIPFGAIPFGAIDVNGAPFGAIPFGAIALGDTNLADIPLDPNRVTPIQIEEDWCTLMAQFNLDCANTATALATTTVLELGVRGVPFGAIPFGAIPFGAIPFGAINVAELPFGAIPFGAIPFGAINLGAVDLNTISLNASPFGAISPSIGSIPFGAIDIQGSPFGAIRLDAIDVTDSPFDAIPFGAIALSELPFGAIPFGAIAVQGSPFGAIPFGAIGAGATVGDIPFGAIDLAASPFGAIPFGAIPFSAIGTIVDCDKIDCTRGTLRDAYVAGAIRPDAPLSSLGDAAADLRLPDLAKFLIGYSAEDLLTAFSEWATTTGTTLADLDDFANMTLGDLPARNALLTQTLLSDIDSALSTVSFLDLALALIFPSEPDPAFALEQTVDDFGFQNGLTLADFKTFGDTPFSDLLPAFSQGQLGDLGAFLAFIHLGELNLFTPAQLADALALRADGTAPWLVSDAVADVNLGLGDMKLADILGTDIWGNATVLDLIDSLPADEVAGFTFADLLLGMLPPGALPWGLAFENVDSADIPGIVPPVTMRTQFALTGTRNRAVEVSVELPTGAAYVPGTTTVSAGLSGSLTPVKSNGRLTWTFSGLQPGVDDVTPGATYELGFDVTPSLSVRSTAVASDARIVGTTTTVSASAFLAVDEAFEPNNTVIQAVDAFDDTLYLTNISSEDDIDLFSVFLQENDALAIDLSDQPADFDLVLYRVKDPGTNAPLTRVAPGDPLIPVLDPDAGTTAVIPDQGFRRLDLEDPNLAFVELSNNRGTDDDTIVTERLPAGEYIIQVHGHDGATSEEPVVLQIQIIEAGVVPECLPKGTLNSVSIGVGPNLDNLPDDLNTVILVNESRFEQIYGPAGRTQVVGALDDLVTSFQDDPQIRTLGLSAIVIPIDGFPGVQSAYEFRDDPVGNGGRIEDACDPESSNEIVRQIVSDILDPIRDLHDIDSIVLVGSDDLLPMARLTDATQTANEFDYRNDLTGRDAFNGSFWASTFLSDDPYGETAAVPFGDRYLYQPDAALGRLVEAPQQIRDYIDQFILFDGFLAADTGFVAGYDFLSDGSAAITKELETTIDPDLVDSDLADGNVDGRTGSDALWTADDLIGKLIAGVDNGDNGPDIVSLNAHFDHYRALPSAGDKIPGFNNNFEVNEITDLDPASELFNGSIVFSMGCHSGLNVPDTGQITGILTDWPQALIDQQAVYVGNTGFGYGDTETVGYTERLLQLFARNLVNPVAFDPSNPNLATSIGQAMQFAKQETTGELSNISVYHEKAIQESTLYGLPFFRVGVAPVLAPPVPDHVIFVDPLTNDPASVRSAEASNGPKTTDDGVYFTNIDDNGDPSTISQPGRPIQPSLTFDITDVDPADSTKLEREARGAIILDMASTYVANDPVISRPTFDEAAQAPETLQENIVYPSAPLRITTVERPEGTRQKLVLTTGQYRGTSKEGIQRLDADHDVMVYYSNSTDRSAPTILRSRATVSGNNLVVTATVDDQGGTGVGAVDRVYVLATPSPGATNAQWYGVDLVESATPGRWTGALTFPGAAPAADAIEFIVQAKDEGGNVGVSTNKAVSFSAKPIQLPPPVALTSSVAPNTGNFTAGYYTGEVKVTAEAGGVPITYSLDGGESTTFPALGLTVTGDGIHTVILKAANGDESFLLFTIDTIDPVVTISQPLDGRVIEVGKELKAFFSCQDPSLQICSGMVRPAGQTTGGSAVGSGEAVPTDASGAFTLKVTATDAIGNTATADATYLVNARTVLDVVTGPVAPLELGTPAELSAQFTDLDGANGHTATWNFGDQVTDPTTGTITTPATICTTGPGATTAPDPTCTLTAPTDATTPGLTTATFNYPNPGVYEVTVTITDEHGLDTTNTFQHVIVNARPVLDVVTGPVAPLELGTPAELSAQFTDLDGANGHTATWNFGDQVTDPTTGTITTPATICTTGPGATTAPDPTCTLTAPTDATTPGLTTATFNYPNPGVYEVTVTITDEHGLDTTNTFQHVIVNARPVLDVVTGPVAPLELGTPAELSAQFTDLDGANGHTATWNFGDQVTDPTTGTITTPATICTTGPGATTAPDPTCTLTAPTDATTPGLTTATFNYPNPGVYEVTVTITDEHGLDTTNTFRHVVVYDPSAGFATGGGWFIPGGDTSNANDFLPGLDPALDNVDKATFAFVVKYKKGAQTPNGKLTFHYEAGDFKFKSTEMEWLVINPSRAQFKGIGTIKGLPGLYQFKVEADDKDEQPNQSDRFVIKFWDNGANSGDDSQSIHRASGDLGGGQIKVKTK